MSLYLSVCTVFMVFRLPAPIQIFDSLNSKTKKHISFFANQIQTTFGGGLKCDSNQIFTDASQSGRSGRSPPPSLLRPRLKSSVATKLLTPTLLQQQPVQIGWWCLDTRIPSVHRKLKIWFEKQIRFAWTQPKFNMLWQTELRSVLVSADTQDFSIGIRKEKIVMYNLFTKHHTT